MINHLDIRAAFARPIALMLALLSAPALEAGVGDGFPTDHWAHAQRPEELGYSSERLKTARALSERMGSAAVMVVVDGVILDEWGATSRPFLAHSMRKSLLTSMYGALVLDGQLRRDATLAELGIDDDDPLTADERRATLRDLLRSRSGVYLPALALEGALDLPPRGSHAAGSYFHYNNWDFNVLGTIFRTFTGEDLGAAFQRRIAGPLQMEDFRPEDWTITSRTHDDAILTRHPAYPLRISARDLARFGLLYLNRGQWRGKTVVPAAWVDECLTPSSTTSSEHERFGYANWTVLLEDKLLPGGIRVPGRIYHASGINVHRVYVVPQLRMVMVHRVNTDLPVRRPAPEDIDRLLGAVISARITDLGAALREAAHKGEADVVQALLAAGADASARDEQGVTALHRAAARGDVAIARLLLASGAAVSARDLRGRTPLLNSLGGNVELVRLLLAQGADANDRSPHDGQTALMWAVALGAQPATEALLAKGAEAGAEADVTRHTALMLASARGDVAAVTALIGAGANPQAQATSGVSALILARALRHTEVEQLLKAAGAESDGAALLPPAAYVPEWIAHLAEWGRLRGIDETRALVTRTAIVRSDGSDALLAAAARGDAPVVRRMEPPDSSEGQGWSPLIVAAAYGHEDVVRLLLERHADLNRVDPRLGQSALIWAAQNGRGGTLELLLKAKADVDARDSFGSTALAQSVAWRQLDTVKRLLAAGADVRSADALGRTALHEAMDGGDPATIRVLLAAGAPLDVRDQEGRTPLMAAVIGNKPEALALLLAAGANSSLQDAHGQTALDLARTLDQAASIQQLSTPAHKRLPLSPHEVRRGPAGVR